MSILSNSQGLLFSQISIEESKEFQATTLQGWFGAQQSGQAKALVTSTVVACKGVVTHTVGEAVLSSFPDAASALKAALEIQTRLANSQKAPGMVVRVRIALAFGPVRVLAGRVSGDAVAAAGMLLDKSKPGEILVDQSLKDALGSSTTVKLTPYGKVEPLTAYLVGEAPKPAADSLLGKTLEITARPPAAPPPAPARAPAKPPPPAAEEIPVSRPRAAASVPLALTYAGQTRRFTPADGEIGLGRALDNHINVPVIHVSRKHAKIVWEGEGPVLVNLSQNGCCIQFDSAGGTPRPCADRMPLQGSGAIALAPRFGQSPSGADIVKFFFASK